MFIPQKVTVPANDAFKEIQLMGCGVIVEKMPTYADINDIPTLHFNDQSATGQRLYPQSKYSSPDFTRLFIKGTAQAENDTIYILISDSPVTQEISPNLAISEAQNYPVPSADSPSGETVQSTDAAQYLTAAFSFSDTTKWKKALVSVDGADIKFFLNGRTPTTTNGHLLKDGDFFILNPEEASGFRFISAAATTPANLSLTYYV